VSIRFSGINTDDAEALRNGGLDANGQRATRAVSDGDGLPCRHCLQLIPKGAGYLVFALRPFSTIQPYAEVGPAFLCEEFCEAYSFNDSALPPVLEHSSNYIVRGYGTDERIVYGTGGVVAKEAIVERAEEILDPLTLRLSMCVRRRTIVGKRG